MFFVRKANPTDYAEIANIHFKSWRATYADLLPTSYINDKNDLCKKTEMWQSLMAHPDVIVWVAYDNADNIVGFIGYFAHSKDYEITTLYVLPNYQGLGIGTQLMKASLQDILECHIDAYVYLWVLAGNIAAIEFYQRLGFVHNGENSEERYKGTKIIDIKMVRKLDELNA